ncbi:hypothetical protein HD554DRAFT_2070462 [Boletus coccyginus]|nr:hypothetical protein HD554DRAFT_2070462 [Boletus coccyginus]
MCHVKRHNCMDVRQVGTPTLYHSFAAPSSIVTIFDVGKAQSLMDTWRSGYLRLSLLSTSFTHLDVGSQNLEKAISQSQSATVSLLILATTCTLGLLYLLWRRASSLRAVVSHQLKTWTTQEGQIRLSEDDGPAATEFLTDEEVPGTTDHSGSSPRPTGALESSHTAQ